MYFLTDISVDVDGKSELTFQLSLQLPPALSFQPFYHKNIKWHFECFKGLHLSWHISWFYLLNSNLLQMEAGKEALSSGLTLKFTELNWCLF